MIRRILGGYSVCDGLSEKQYEKSFLEHRLYFIGKFLAIFHLKYGATKNLQKDKKIIIQEIFFELEL